MPKLEDVIKEMNTKTKEEVVTFGIPSYTRKRIPFTSPRMNYCTFGGIPVGKLTEFFGEEHGGKTTTALDIIANYQQMDDPRKVLYVDAENSLDEDWARTLGVNVDDIIVFKPTTQSAEAIFQFILNAVDTGSVGLWVLDSIGALASQQELDKSIEEKTYAGVSAALTVFGRKIEMAMQKHQCTGISINQIREDLNSSWGGIKTPGGKAWKHFCCVRMQFSKGKYYDENGEDMKMSAENPAGNYVLMSMVKNKSCPPTRRTGFYALNYAYGVDYLKDLIEVAMKYNLVDKSGSWYGIVDPETGAVVKKVQGLANVYGYFEDEANEAVLSRIEAVIDQKIYTD